MCLTTDGFPDYASGVILWQAAVALEAACVRAVGVRPARGTRPSAGDVSRRRFNSTVGASGAPPSTPSGDGRGFARPPADGRRVRRRSEAASAVSLSASPSSLCSSDDSSSHRVRRGGRDEPYVDSEFEEPPLSSAAGAASTGAGGAGARRGGRVHTPSALKSKQKSAKNDMAAGVFKWIEEQSEAKKQEERSNMLLAKATAASMKG